MKSNVKDLFLVIVCLIGLYLLFQISQNGRYIIDNNILLDTKNGKMYFPKAKEKKTVLGEPDYYWDFKYDEVK